MLRCLGQAVEIGAISNQKGFGIFMSSRGGQRKSKLATGVCVPELVELQLGTQQLDEMEKGAGRGAGLAESHKSSLQDRPTSQVRADEAPSSPG